MDRDGKTSRFSKAARAIEKGFAPPARFFAPRAIRNARRANTLRQHPQKPPMQNPPNPDVKTLLHPRESKGQFKTGVILSAAKNLRGSTGDRSAREAPSG